MHRLEISTGGVSRRSEITIGTGIRKELGRAISSSPLEPKRLALITNDRVFGLYGKQVVRSLKREGIKVFEFLMPEGERFKSFRILEQAVKFLGDNRFERNDAVVALGGGVVGDLAGFSAAVYLRGIPVIQVPTTLLSQIDSSVGGKTGINLPIGKNLVGAFHQPALVAIDTETLASLPAREVISGLCEMVKQALVSSRSLFDKTVRILGDANRSLVNENFAELIADHVAFKASIVAGDERESLDRTDAKSRKVLNFGHTTGHALEAATNYRTFRHGEAVGYGMLVAGELSHHLGLLNAADLKLLREAVALCGPLPRTEKVDFDDVTRALKHDKKSVAGQINWVLLKGLGLPQIVEGKLISEKLIRLSLQAGLQTPERDRKKVPQ
jgi:3-dehydroquinate synthase